MIQVGKHQIGDGLPPFIVAEVGSNWRTLDDCKNSITLAKACGADAVKFQAYNWDALYGTRDGADYYAPSADAVIKVRDTSLPLDWLPLLRAKADAVGIEFMCTAFSPELVDAVDPFVNVHKVASAELTHLRLLEKIRAKGKPVFLSTGASGEADIRRALQVLQSNGPESCSTSSGQSVPVVPVVPVVLLYCVAAYPARRVDPRIVGLMADHYGVPAGFSDHTTDVYSIPREAVGSGACVIEKHVNFVGAEGPDAPHSLDCDEFMAMVKGLKGKGSEESCLQPGPTREERPMILRHNRRLIATRAIAVGETFREGENFGAYRSLKDDTHALSPWAIGQVNGRTAQKAIQPGGGIGPGDFG